MGEQAQDGIDPSRVCHSCLPVFTESHGKSHARKLTAAMAIPTPKRTPASTRFEPPSPKAKVRPETTIATRDRPRAMVLVKASEQFPHERPRCLCGLENAGKFTPSTEVLLAVANRRRPRQVAPSRAG